jgi:glycosyltransferase involved in cell wall biosynthesis
MGIDVALAEYGTTGVEVSAACKRARVPLVVHFHGFDTSSHAVAARYLAGYRRMFEDAQALIAVSTLMKNQLIAWGAPPAKIHLSVYGVDQTRFNGAAPDQAAAHFLAVGRFVEKKGPLLTIRAFRNVVDADPTATLSMVGDGPLLDAARRTAAEMGLSDNIGFLGVRDHAGVSALMKKARAFVQHSVTAADGDSEGTPVAILEAQMSGLPVVATRHAGIPEVVVPGETGFLVDEGDVIGMAAMMTKLALDPVLAGTLGKRARERAIGRFTLERHLQDLTRILEVAVKQG